ncbi:MAG: hypothetical protein ACI808_001548, partial [Paraglaciecola sp.]
MKQNKGNKMTTKKETKKVAVSKAKAMSETAALSETTA